MKKGCSWVNHLKEKEYQKEWEKENQEKGGVDNE